MKQFISTLPFLRPLVIKLLKLTAFDFRIKNHWTNDRLSLNSFRHKGYWYLGKKREAKAMATFQRLIQPGYQVIEVGGHIGYISQFFAKLVGQSGKVVVFEPGTNNYGYIKKNTDVSETITLETAAVSNKNGTAIFYEDNVTGQNNSLDSEYQGAESVAKLHNMELTRTEKTVDLVTLDSYAEKHGMTPDFVKIDAESVELSILEGMPQTLKTVKAMMVEVTSDRKAVSDILLQNDFMLIDENEREYPTLPEDFYGNIFAIKKNA